jgi:phosphoribosylformylglycinamidine synthase
MLWHLQVRPAPGQPDHEARRVLDEAHALGVPGPWTCGSSRGFVIEGNLDPDELGRVARALLRDPVVETIDLTTLDEPAAAGPRTVVHVLPRPGVTDPVADSAAMVLRDAGLAVEGVRSTRSYLLDGPPSALDRLVAKVLANVAVEQAVVGALALDHLGQGRPYRFRLVTVPLRDLDDEALRRVSRDGQLALSLDEMRTIQAHYRDLGRDPTDCELETLAQTWSEHCSHKTLKGRIDFDGEIIDNLLKQTVFRATKELEADGLDWLVSVFHDNAGVVRFDDENDVCFKVETHNHPSAIDPYGGSNTGLGGVIRDVLGTGRAAKPIANTDVFCVAPPDTDPSTLPPGVIHPRRVLDGVIAGVRDYGNRMGIPTVNGAVVADPRYLGNPLVFCGTVGVLPRGFATKSVEPGDLIVALGGRTGRDGIHGATFSSLELSSESEDVSAGSVQIGNAITEKMVADVVLQARDLGLFRSITDCGAGGFSSAVGEMGAECGAEVHLDRAPLKYEGLSYAEIWISEAQERMVLAVPPEHRDALWALCDREGVEPTELGTFTDTGRLRLHYEGNLVGDLDMAFLHDGRPDVVRPARFTRPAVVPAVLPDRADLTADLLAVLGFWDVASKEWIVRQYDHEVQGRTVIKPLVGHRHEGPGDAAVVLPVRGSSRGLSVSCGLNPRTGDLDPYAMAACAIDEAVRNAVAVGADPDRIALLDNFCWGSPERPETLGSLVLAARACRDLALAYRAPFISGKDSLYNEYSSDGTTLAIPPTLLISAIGIVPDVSRCVTMDLKAAGNALIVVGATRDELGGSCWLAATGGAGGVPPRVEPDRARRTFQAMHQAIARGLARSCHDLSDGGLAAGLAEMAIAGGLGLRVHLAELPREPGSGPLPDATLLFSESPTRFVVEVEPTRERDFLALFDGLPAARIGAVTAETTLIVEGAAGAPVLSAPVSSLRSAWAHSPHPIP